MQAVVWCLVDVWYVLSGHVPHVCLALGVAALMRCPRPQCGWAAQAVARCLVALVAFWYVLSGHVLHVRFVVLDAGLMRSPRPHHGWSVPTVCNVPNGGQGGVSWLRVLHPAPPVEPAWGVGGAAKQTQPWAARHWATVVLRVHVHDFVVPPAE